MTLLLFAVLPLQMLVVCGNVVFPSLSHSNASPIVEDHRPTPLLSLILIAKDTPSPRSTNSPNYQNASSLAESEYPSVKKSDAAAIGKRILNCENTTVNNHEYLFILNFIYSQIVLSLDPSVYVQDGDLVTVCRAAWLKKANEIFGVLALMHACLIVFLTNRHIVDAFYRGRKAFKELISTQLWVVCFWFLLYNRSNEDFFAIIRLFAGVANMILIWIYTWVTIFTSSVVMNYLNSRRYIQIIAYSDKQYSINIINVRFFVTCVVSTLFLTILTLLIGVPSQFPRAMYGDFPGLLPKDQIILYFIPVFLLIVPIWFIINITNNLFHCPEVGRFHLKFKYLQMLFSTLLAVSLTTYLVALHLSVFARVDPEWVVYTSASVVAMGTAAGFYSLRKFRDSSEFNYEANAQEPGDFTYMIRVVFEMTNKCAFGWVVKK